MDQKTTSNSLESTTPPRSKAARFNAHTLRKLSRALSRDQEIDLISQMPIKYSDRLADMRDSAESLSESTISPFIKLLISFQ